MTTLFKWENFRSHAGVPLEWKIDCDTLTDDDLDTLAVLIARRVGLFSEVEGVPRGGLRLAEKLKRYRSHGPLLIVDDVLTTGSSIEEHRAGRDAVGYVLFARGPLPAWAKALFTLDAVHP